MELLTTMLEGCYELRPRVFQDERGRFIKTFHEEIFSSYGLPIDWKEEYYSISRKGVIRGMHFQIPPLQHCKMVYCLKGEVLDVVLDLRANSKTYGNFLSIKLSAETGNILVIPEGMAHGFCAMTDEVIMQYKVSSVYSAEHDSGILWNSFGFDWPEVKPIISERDASFVPLNDFTTPFVMQ